MEANGEMPGVLVQIRSASLGYAGRSVLTGVDLDIRQGDHVGIVGPNGSGKTTLLRSVLGLLRPIAGEVTRFAGVTVGYVPQRDTVDPEYPLTVLDIVMMGLYRRVGALHRLGKPEREAGMEALAHVGLADQSDNTASLHTATHLLHQALRQVLGDHVKQAGSNITAERLRFDFSHADRVLPEQLAEVERIVNAQIDRDLPVDCSELSYDEAAASGAIGLFAERYGERVKVYSIGDFSKEICGGPHAPHTGCLGRFKISKEESSSRGVRRIKAVLISGSAE